MVTNQSRKQRTYLLALGEGGFYSGLGLAVLSELQVHLGEFEHHKWDLCVDLCVPLALGLLKVDQRGLVVQPRGLYVPRFVFQLHRSAVCVRTDTPPLRVIPWRC